MLDDAMTISPRATFLWCAGWLNQTTNIPKMATNKLGNGDRLSMFIN